MWVVSPKRRAGIFLERKEGGRGGVYVCIYQDKIRVVRRKTLEQHASGGGMWVVGEERKAGAFLITYTKKKN